MSERAIYMAALEKAELDGILNLCAANIAGDADRHPTRESWRPLVDRISQTGGDYPDHESWTHAVNANQHLIQSLMELIPKLSKKQAMDCHKSVAVRFANVK